MTSATDLGIHYPDATDATNIPGDMGTLAGDVNTLLKHMGIQVLTTVQRNALVGGDLFTGRTIYNSTTRQYEQYDATAAVWIATNGGWVFASTAARDASITAPIKGMEAIITNIGTMAVTMYDGTAWRTLEVWGTGSPEGVITATVGAIFHRTDGAIGLVQYSKESGSGNTGWLLVGGSAGTDFAFFVGA